jgi:putative sigma-54 modulation protein
VQIKFSARHGHVSEETRDWITEKIERLPRLYDRILAIEVVVDLEHRETPSVELRVLAKQNEFVAAHQAEGLPASVDGVVEKMEQQLRKHKEKIQDRHRGPGSKPGGATPSPELEAP